MTKGFVRRWRSAVDQFGIFDAGLYIVHRLLETRTRRSRLFKYYFYSQPVSGAQIIRADRNSKAEIRKIEKGDPVLRDFPVPGDVIEQRYAQDSVCLGVFVKGELAGYGWLLLGPYREDEVRCRFIPQPAGRAAWDFDIYIYEPFRFGMTFARLWGGLNQYLAEHGIEWTMSRVSAFNPGSVASHRRLGAVRFGSALFLSVGGLQVMLSSRRPLCHLSFSPHSVPDIRVRPPARNA